MQLYSGSTTRFLADVERHELAAKLQERFFDEYRYQPPEAEVRAWTNSLSAMAAVVASAGFDDHGVLVEYQLPLTSRRLDCMLTGSATGRPAAVIVELKQWDYALPSWVDECVTTTVGMRERDVLHPSAQAEGYRRYLLDTNTAFVNGDIHLSSCAYLHHMQPAAAGEILAPKHAHVLTLTPTFVATQAPELTAYLSQRLADGNGGDVLERVIRGRYRPHKQLLEHTARSIRNEPSWILLDEQRVAFNAVLTKVRERHAGTGQTVLLVTGGPGTGKSVVAINLVAELAGSGIPALHATGSRAFTENLRRAVGNRASALFKYFNSFQEAEPEEFDVLVLDEAHRIREFSWNWRTPKRLRTDRTQLDELLRAAKIAVFFIDDMQVVRPGEVGSSELIRLAATGQGIEVIEFHLEAQFRCNGSEAFVAWVENTLGIRRTANVMWDARDEFELVIVDSPHELDAWVTGRSKRGTARLSAGFCWPWSNPLPDGTLVEDVKIGDWSMPWNAKPDAPRRAPGVPRASYWATDPAGVGQVGCIYTAQGFEYDYAGVIVGRDLVYRPGSGWVGQKAYSEDSVVKRSAHTDDEFTTLVKNAYRVLLTRGLRGCAVYFDDAPTRDFVRSRIEAVT